MVQTPKGLDTPGRHSEPLSLVNGGSLLVPGHQPRANLVNRPFQGEQFRPTLTLFALTTCNNVDESHKHHGEQMKADTKENVMNDSICIKYKNSQNYMPEARLVFTQGERVVSDRKSSETSFWGVANVLFLHKPTG